MGLNRRPPADITDFGLVLEPSEAQEPILSRPVRGALMDWLTEIWAADALAEVGLTPRRRALFDGVPGVGKTTLAHHLAARLGLPILVVLPDSIMTTYVSMSAAALGALFDALGALEEPVLVFFDEFESLAQTRMHGGTNKVGEADHNHTVNTLLNRLERYGGFVVAATNTGAEIDPAVWRRFEIHTTLDLPGQPERRRILARYLAPYGLPRPALEALAESFETASPALMRQFAEGLKRQIVVGPKAGWNMAREAVVARLIAAVQPHPDAGKPRLWSHGPRDAAVRAMPWPLPHADDLAADATDDATTGPEDDTVVALRAVGGTEPPA